MRNRMEEIKAKGFNIVQGSKDVDYQETTGYRPAIDYGKMKIGAKTLEDAVINLGTYKKINPRLADKQNILRAIENYDLKTMREISDFFYKTSGMYARIIRYMAFMYRYDWFVTSYTEDTKDMVKINMTNNSQAPMTLEQQFALLFAEEESNETAKNNPIEQQNKMKPVMKTGKKLIDGFYSCLKTLDDFEVKKTLGEIALKVLRDGAYYGYKVETSTGLILQELPVNYCRSMFHCGKKDAVEFNMKFFDEYFRDTTQRNRILKMFPPEFNKGYSLYKQGKLTGNFPGDDSGWYLLDPKMTVKFTANGEDYPAFISAIPLIIDLDEARELDKKKTLQRLLKIVVQKMPMDKNGDLIFDVEEAQQLHNNAVQMLGKAIGVDVLTTFADVEVESLSDTNAATSQSDDLQRIERQVYNDAGISQNQFNATGNLALTNSLLNDAATMSNLVYQFENFLNEIISKYNTNKKFYFRVQILPTTIYNYQELAKLYKEQTQLGCSKMLPSVALGQSQSSVLANAYFENSILDLVNVFIPPLMSSTMNSDILNTNGGGAAPQQQQTQAQPQQKKKSKDGENKALDKSSNSVERTGKSSDEGKVGRKEKPDSQKSDKTIANREAMG